MKTVIGFALLACYVVACSSVPSSSVVDPFVATSEAATNYLREVTAFSKEQNADFATIDTLLDMASDNAVLRTDADWKEQIHSALQNLSAAANHFKALPAAPEQYAKADSWLRKAADETLAYVRNMSDNVDNMDYAAKAAASANLGNINAYFKEASYEMDKAIGK
jgi:predicted choloylglycine hydrolase